MAQYNTLLRSGLNMCNVYTVQSEKKKKSICLTNYFFSISGEKGFNHRTDTGWYGKGVYFSEYPSYSMGYISGANQLLLCQVLPGKVFNCTKLIHGAALQKGYDSHTSPDKKELVVFNSHHILPSYIVHYKSGTGEFKYKVYLVSLYYTPHLQSMGKRLIGCIFILPSSHHILVDSSVIHYSPPNCVPPILNFDLHYILSYIVHRGDIALIRFWINLGFEEHVIKWGIYG